MVDLVLVGRWEIGDWAGVEWVGLDWIGLCTNFKPSMR